MDREVIAFAFATLEAGGCRPPPYHQTEAGLDQALDLWAELLEGVDGPSLRKSISTYLRSPDSQYWPTPGQLLQHISHQVPTPAPPQPPPSLRPAALPSPSVAPTPTPAPAAPTAAPAPAPAAPTPEPEQVVFQEPEPEQVVFQEPEPKQVVFQEPEPEQVVFQEPEPEQVVFQEPEPEQVVFQEPEPEQVVFQEPEPPQVVFQEPEPPQVVFQEPEPPQVPPAALNNPSSPPSTPRRGTAAPPPRSVPPTSPRSLFGSSTRRQSGRPNFSFPPQDSPARPEPALPPSMKKNRHSPSFDPSELPPAVEEQIISTPEHQLHSLPAQVQITDDPEPQSEPKPAAVPEAPKPPTPEPRAQNKLQGEPLFPMSDLREYEESETESLPPPLDDTDFDGFPTEEFSLSTEESPTLPANFSDEPDEGLPPATLPTLAPQKFEWDEEPSIPHTDEIPSMMALEDMSDDNFNDDFLSEFSDREITDLEEDEFDRELSEMRRISEAQFRRKVGMVVSGVVTLLAIVGIIVFALSGGEDIEEEHTSRAKKDAAADQELDMAATAPELGNIGQGSVEEVVIPDQPTKAATKPKPKPKTAAKPKPKTAAKPKPKTVAKPKPSPTPAPVAIVAPEPAPTGAVWGTAPAPAPAPAPSPKSEDASVWGPPAPAPASSNSSNLVEKGWNTVDSNPEQAAKYFKQALDMNSSNHEANLGYGYCLMKLEKLQDAQRYLCRARRSTDVETQREATQFLLNKGLTCN